MSKLLIDHDEIRDWVATRAGSPAKTEVPDGHGGDDANLHLVFGQRIFDNAHDEARDQLGGIELITWAEWFEEFEKHQLALRVQDDRDGPHSSAYTFDKRR